MASFCLNKNMFLLLSDFFTNQSLFTCDTIASNEVSMFNFSEMHRFLIIFCIAIRTETFRLFLDEI